MVKTSLRKGLFTALSCIALLNCWAQPRSLEWIGPTVSQQDNLALGVSSTSVDDLKWVVGTYWRLRGVGIGFLWNLQDGSPHLGRLEPNAPQDNWFIEYVGYSYIEDVSNTESAFGRYCTSIFQCYNRTRNARSFAFALSKGYEPVREYAAGMSENGAPMRWDLVANQILEMEDGSGNPASGIAYGISSDGTILVGRQDDNNQQRAFWWNTSNGASVNLALGRIAYSVSWDGRTVVGVGGSDQPIVWYIRDNNGGHGKTILPLPSHCTTPAVARSISADGNRVVGWATHRDYGDRTVALLWVQVRPTVWRVYDMNDLFPDNRLFTAVDISPNGRFVTGHGNGTESFYEYDSWVADLGEGCLPKGGDVDANGCVDDADLLAVLFAFGNSGSNLAEDMNCDGAVDDTDLLIVLFNFGWGC